MVLIRFNVEMHSGIDKKRTASSADECAHLQQLADHLQTANPDYDAQQDLHPF